MSKKAMSSKTTAGEIVRRILKEKVMSQEEMSKRIGLKTQSGLSERLRGDIRVENLMEILDVLGYDIVLVNRANAEDTRKIEWKEGAMDPTPVADGE